MPREKFDGEIDGKPVKEIVVDKGYKKEWFAKPKDFDIATPHFEQWIGGKLEIHLDSPDGKSFKKMTVYSIYSGSFLSGSFFAESRGMDIAVLPMNSTADRFVIDTSESGSYVRVPQPNEWVLMALGTFGPWRAK